jgi:NAD(P)-dependent dehydrogenase (short-subunit alcohol dehydrogenase family)
LGQLEGVLTRLHRESGPFRIIVNNFGINHLSWIGTTPVSDAEIFHVNVLVPYWVINTLVSLGGPARVLNIASQTYRVPQRCTALYAASKAALVQMTKVMARELAPHGWVINALAPGKIEGTAMTHRTDEQVQKLRTWSQAEADAYALGMIPMERFTSCDEVADIAMRILELPDYVNGTVIEAMGGV